MTAPNLEQLPIWLTVLGFVVPALTLAGSAGAFVIKLYLDQSARRRTHFFELMQFIDGNGPIASKMAAVYRMRDFAEHREFAIRFCDSQAPLIVGPTSAPLSEEMRRTSAHMKKQRNFFRRIEPAPDPS